MKNNTEAVKNPTSKTQPQAPKDPMPKVKVQKAKQEAPVKATKEAAKDGEAEPTDRLPATVEELKESKGGLVTYPFLSGKDKDTIAKELGDAFKLPEAQAVKILRRITGRARFLQRALALMAAK